MVDLDRGLEPGSENIPTSGLRDSCSLIVDARKAYVAPKGAGPVHLPRSPPDRSRSAKGDRTVRCRRSRAFRPTSNSARDGAHLFGCGPRVGQLVADEVNG